MNAVGGAARPEGSATGSIRVRFDTESVFLSNELPHQLRNADMRVLDSGHGNHTYSVPAGLYSVEAVSPDGGRQSFVVNVLAAKAAEVIIEPRAPASRRDRDHIEAATARAPAAPSVATSRPKPMAPVRQADGPVVGPSIVCATCAFINPTSRRFCQRCGSSLGHVAPSRSTSWWSRLRRRIRRSGDHRSKHPPDWERFPPSAHRGRPVEPTTPRESPEPNHVGAAPVNPVTDRMPVWELTSVGARLRSDDVRLTAMVGCALETADGAQLVLRPIGELDEPAHITFDIAGDRVVMSLPVDRHASPPLGNAVVAASRHASGVPRLVAGFTDQRRVATVIDAMSGNGSFADSEALVREASNLLLHKYADPSAAALGALMLQRLGRLDDRESWVSNLAARFPWLPDGKALHASLLRSGDDDQRRTGLQLLLEAAKQRPMFTDGLSLMINLLRRWPDDESTEQRRVALDALGHYIVAADLDAVFLTVITREHQSHEGP